MPPSPPCWRLQMAESIRVCFANDPPRNAGSGFLDNTVKTSKYTAGNFVPKFLFEQFSRFVNAYFLVVCVLQAVPSISLTAGIPTQAFALAFVMFFDGVLTASEDYKRHAADKRANGRRVLVMDPGVGDFVERQWKDVGVVRWQWRLRVVARGVKGSRGGCGSVFVMWMRLFC